MSGSTGDDGCDRGGVAFRGANNSDAPCVASDDVRERASGEEGRKGDVPREDGREDSHAAGRRARSGVRERRSIERRSACIVAAVSAEDVRESAVSLADPSLGRWRSMPCVYVCVCVGTRYAAECKYCTAGSLPTLL